ncbi:MAG: hypothetical protein ACI4GD_07205, partial [Lachnospiraceae bacterium]
LSSLFVLTLRGRMEIYMNEKLEMNLGKEFPFMRNQHNRNDTNDEKSIFCECLDGWYQLIHDLCCEIKNLYDRNGKEVELYPIQIKEKFGGLRFYVLYIDDCDKELANASRKIINDFESKSYNICERCGEAGTLRRDLSWLETLCDDCYCKVKNR